MSQPASIPDDVRAARLTVLFASLGHLLIHLLTAFFFVIVLGLEEAWQRPYHELIGLWTLGALFVGAGAIPAGWLADRWSAPGMLVLMFAGMGVACLLCALASGPGSLLVGLSILGAFAAIYHPVGIPWIVRSTTAKGSALAFNGVFGSLGVAASGLLTGLLMDHFGWRSAFALPGLLSLAAGVGMEYCRRAGWLSEGVVQVADLPPQSTSTRVRVYVVLLTTMFLLGMIYQSSQTAFPKVFDIRLRDIAGAGATGIGAMISFVYVVAGVMQLLGGWLADRYALKWIYFGSFLFQVPVLLWVGGAAGLPLVVAATIAVLLGTAALPAENLLLARYTPPERHGLAFGIKFVVAFSTAPLAIGAVAWIQKQTGEFTALFGGLAIFAAIGVLAVALLPPDRRPSPMVSASS